MKLLNTVTLPNQFVAQGINHIAVYRDGVVSLIQKDKPNSKLAEASQTYNLMGVRSVRISPSGEYIAVQTKTKTVRMHNGVQENFDNNVGAYSIADTGQIVMIALASGAVQVIDSSVTNLTVAVTDDDRVVCAKGRYMVYNRARTITATYSDLVLTPVASVKEIVYVTHDHNGKFVVFYADNTFSVGGGAAKTLVAPAQGFRDVGDQVLCTDMKKDWTLSHFRPLAYPETFRNFAWKLPALSNTDFEDLRLMAPGSGFNSADFDLKNGVVVENATGVTSVADSPYGISGKSLSFNGTTSNLRTADSANITLGSSDFTIELFVKINSGTTAITTLVQKGGGASIAWPSFLLQAVVASKAFCFAASFNNTGVDVGTYDGTSPWGAFEFDVWTHIAITRKGNTWRCFQDGKLRAKYTGNGTLFPNTGRGITVGGSRGTNYTSGALYGQLKGNVNGFQIMNYAKYVHDFYPEVPSLTPDFPRAKGPANLAFEVPATMGSSLAFNNTNKQITSVSPLKYVDQTGAVVTLPAQSFDNGSILRPMTEDVIVADRSYSGSYYISFNGGQSWVGYSPAGSLGGYQGHACMFKGVLHVLHGVTNTNSTIRKFTNLPNQTSNDIVVSLPFLMALGLDSNENAMVMSSGISSGIRIYITWDGTAYYDYPLAPITYGNAAIEYVGNNVFLITNQLTNIRHFYYVPTTPGTPQLLGTISTDYRRVMQFAQNLVVYKLGQLLSKPYPKRADGYNATQAEAQAYVDFILTIPIDGAANATLAGSAITPLYKQNRISIGNGTTSQIWDV